MSWQTKLAGLITLAMGVVLLTQSIYVIPYIKNQEMEREKAYQQEIARNIAWELDDEIQRIEDRLINLAKLPELRNMNIAEQIDILEQHVAVREYLSSIFVMDADGWFVSADDMEGFSVFTTRSYAEEPYFSVPFEQGETYYAAPRFYPSVNIIAITIALPIESDTGERKGVLMGVMRLNDLIEMVTAYPLEEETVAIVVDKEGTVLAHSDIDLFALEEGPLSMKYEEYEILELIMSGGEGGSMEHPHGDEPYFGTYSILESTDWGVMVERPMSMVMAEASAISRRLLALNGALFGLVMIVALFFSRQIMAREKESVKKLEQSELSFRTVADFTYGWESWVGPDGKLIYVSPSCERITGYNAGELIADSSLMEKIVHPDDREHVVNHMIREFKERGVLSLDYRIINRNGEEKWISHVCQSVYNTGGAWLGRRISNRDMTELKRNEAMLRKASDEKDVLLREIHHRVKNNMQVISSILRLQSRQIEDERLRAILKESQERIQAIALIHEKLYQSTDLAGINFGEYLSSLVTHLSTVYGVNQDKVKIEIDAEDILLDIATAMPCALIVSELVSNSFKYAFPGDRMGEIHVELHHRGDNELELLVSDNGTGFPEKDFHNQKKMGFQLVSTLVAQLGGNIKLDGDGGTGFRIICKQQKLQKERQE